MARPTDDSEEEGQSTGVCWSADLRLTVWYAQSGWHARLVGADMTQRNFASPFELARFLAQAAPAAAPASTPSNTGDGLR